MQEGSVLTISPSFSSYASIGFSNKITQDFSDQMEDFGLEPIHNKPPIQRYYTFSLNQPEDLKPKQHVVLVDKAAGMAAAEEEEGFEFHSLSTDHEALTISADEIFSNGQIRPIYQTHMHGHAKVVEGNVFNKTYPPRHCSLVELLKEDDESSSSSGMKEENENSEAIQGTFCLWRPNPDETPDKSKRNGSTAASKRWRLKDLIPRSNSDGKETLVMFKGSSKKREGNKVEDDSSVPDENVAGKQVKNSGEGEKSAHEIHYIRNRELNKVDRRRSYLPYKKDIIGFFANVNGLTKQLHTF